MAKELRSFVINMKSLSQDIEDPVVAGGGDANGTSLRVIFTQEAAEQFTEHTKVYLKWRHLQTDTRGYNVFKCLEEGDECNPRVWEIHYPQAMLHEGDVLCRLEIVDEISIAPSTNFTVHVLADPDSGDRFVVSDDYSLFITACISMNSFLEVSQEQMEKWEKEFEEMRAGYDDIRKTAEEALDKANTALDMAQSAVDAAYEKDVALSVQMVEYL